MCLLILIVAFFLLILLISTFLSPLPINDSGLTRYRTIPWATLSLIIINTVIFVLWIAPDLYGQTESDQMVLEPDYEKYMTKVSVYGYNEVNLQEGWGIGAFATFSSMFMHAHFWHLFGNMVYLWTFGRRVEDACGSWRFLAFYLLAGMLANLGSVLLDPSVNRIPSVGASGAISGVLGAYLLLFPGAKVNCLWGLGTLIRLPIATVRLLWDKNQKLWKWTITFRAWVLLIAFVVLNTIPSIETIQSSSEIGGVNYLAHLSGILAALTIFFFVRKDLLLRYLHGRSL
jgi:membrane associated rhomboid family serine protease